MTRAYLILCAAAVVAAVLFFAADLRADAAPPAPGLTSETIDLGNGWGQTLWRDAEGRPYDLGEIVPLPGTLEAQRRPAIASTGSIPDMIVASARRWGNDPQQMLRIAWCESKYDPNARNRSGASGVFQFMPGTWAGWGRGSPFDAAANIEAANALMKAEGPRHWVCR